MTGTNSEGVQISVVRTRYSYDDYLAAAIRVAAAAQARTVEQPSGTQPNANFDGLEVGYPAEKLAAMDRAQAEAGLQRTAGLPTKTVTIEPTQGLSRQNDSSPWRAQQVGASPSF